MRADSAAIFSVTTSVDEDSPWLGLASFTEDTRAFFFGREGEVSELERRVQRKLLTVLFGKSGLGKTSILQAGLVPGLRERGYFPVYLRIDYGHDSPEPAEQIKRAIGSAAAGLGGAGDEPTLALDPDGSIWEFLHRRDSVPQHASAATATVKSTPLIPLLIFDQFEEIFTLAQSDEFGRARAARFVEELADLVENRPPKALETRLETDDSLSERFDFSRSDYRVVISLREDYLAPLESLKKQMPSLSQNRLRLAPMTGAQALEAVLLPGNRLRPDRPLVSEEVAEAIVRFVAGGAELANAEVEPSLLSLICRELNDQRIAQHRAEISLDLVAGSHEGILTSFYERALADQPAAVRRLIEDELLTESGYRENLAEESLQRKLQTAGAAPDALATLVNRRLLRIEERLDVRRVELTHDVLTGVVKASRDQRHEREAREATERLLAEQGARETAARRALRRARAIAAGCTVLAVAAVIAAVLAFVNVRRARVAETEARQTRTVSEQARAQAEGLLGFLSDDFVRELETFGRYQTIAELSQREIEYFEALPPPLKDPQSIRNGALALVNHSLALQSLGDLGAAHKNAAEAIQLLEPLRQKGDRSDSTAVVLARAYTSLGWAIGLQNSLGAHSDGVRATALLRPIAGGTDAPVETRRAYVEALNFLGWWGTTSNQKEENEEAVRAGEEALQVAVQLGAGRRGDATLDADYANAGGWLAVALPNLGRNEEALRVGNAALAVADRVVTQYPQFGAALLAKSTIDGGLSEVAFNELDPAESLRFATQGVQTALALLKLEPGNMNYVAQLAFMYAEAGPALWAAGRSQDSIAYDRKAMAAFDQAGAGEAYDLAGVSDSLAAVAGEQAQLGEAAGVAASVTAADEFTSARRLRALGLSGSYTELFINVLRAYPAAALAYERNDFATARRIARDSLAQLRAARANGEFETSLMNDALYRLSDIEGHAEYRLGDFTAAAQAERTALEGCKDSAWYVYADPRRITAAITTWLSMALAAQGRQAEAAQTIAPVVTMYRTFAKKNHGDQWLPLELAEALYAQSLTDARQRPARLREAARLVDHLTPTIAALRDTRAWRARIEKAQDAAAGAAVAP